jgi:hypothetical protein
VRQADRLATSGRIPNRKALLDLPGAPRAHERYATPVVTADCGANGPPQLDTRSHFTSIGPDQPAHAFWSDSRGIALVTVEV